MRTVTIIAAIVALVAVGGVVAYSLINKKPTTPTQSPTPQPQSQPSQSTQGTTTTSSTPVNSILSADPNTEADNSKKRFASAQSKISQWALWKANAVFTGLFMTFDAKLELNSTNEVYVFDTSDDPLDHFTVSVAQGSGNMLRAIVPTADFQGPLQPIKPEFWQSNYVDAVQFANNNGGKAFSAANTVTSVEVKLYRVPPNNFLDWVVIYKTKDTGTSLTITMDAKDKTLVKQ